MSENALVEPKIGKNAGAPVADNAADEQPLGRLARPRLKSVTIEEGKMTLEGTKEEHEWLDQAFGSDSGEFQSYCIAQLLGILPGKDCENYTFLLNAALPMLAAIGPKDEFEAMLAVQMVAAHHASMEMTGRTVRTDNLDFKQTYGGLATKFQRTFVAQMEALGRHRRGGKQIVEHVHVGAGGQAVIAGTVNTGGRGA